MEKQAPARIMTAKKTTHSSSHLRARSTSGAPTTTMGQACGHFTTQKTVRRTRHLQAQQPKPTSPPLTLWTVIRTWNDDCTRVKRFLGSGWQFQTTSCGWCSQKTWACHLLPSALPLSSSSSSFLRRTLQKDQSNMCPRNTGPPRACGSNHCARP